MALFNVVRSDVSCEMCQKTLLGSHGYTERRLDPDRDWGENGCPLWELTTSTPSENFPDTLNCAEVEIFPQKKCKDVYPGEVTDAMICAGDSNGADSCQVSDFWNPLFPLSLTPQ